MSATRIAAPFAVALVAVVSFALLWPNVLDGDGSGGQGGSGPSGGPVHSGGGGQSGAPGQSGGGTAVLVGAGDIATCSSRADSATADLLEAFGGTVFTVGDNVYERGTTAEFRACYEPTWGRVKSRTRPSPGNHDYGTPGAAGYFGYFGAVAGDPADGYYAYDLGSWRVYSLNSNCEPIGGCQTGSRQARWLQADLADRPRTCVLAYWHHPHYSSGPHGSDPSVADLWRILQDVGAEVVVSGHDHHYERFAPQDHRGVAVTRGIRAFVVGTGGANLRGFGSPVSNSEVLEAKTHGVLAITLMAAGYRWAFIPVAGATFTDAGSGECH